MFHPHDIKASIVDISTTTPSILPSSHAGEQTLHVAPAVHAPLPTYPHSTLPPLPFQDKEHVDIGTNSFSATLQDDGPLYDKLPLATDAHTFPYPINSSSVPVQSSTTVYGKQHNIIMASQQPGNSCGSPGDSLSVSTQYESNYSRLAPSNIYDNLADKNIIEMEERCSGVNGEKVIGNDQGDNTYDRLPPKNPL